MEQDPRGNVLAEYQTPSFNPLANATANNPVGSELGLLTYDVPDKAVWFYEANTYEFGRLDPATGAITEHPVFSHTDPALDLVSQIVAGPDGNIYYTEPNLNKIGLLDIKTHLVSQFNMILADTQPQGIVVGGDGQLWFTEGGQNKIGSLDPLSHVVTNYPFEPPSHATNDQAEGITAGPNNTLWFVERQNNKIQEFDIASETSRRYSIPSTIRHRPRRICRPPSCGRSRRARMARSTTPSRPIASSDASTLPPASTSRSSSRPPPAQVPPPNETSALIANGVKGSVLWVSPPSSQARYNIDTTTDYYSNLPPPPPVVPTNDANDVVSVGSKLYFTDSTDGVGAIEMFDPATQMNTPFEVPPLFVPQNGPPPNQFPNQMAVDSNGKIWFTETKASKPNGGPTGAIGEFDPSTDSIVSQTYLTAASTDPEGIAWDPIEEQFWITEPAANQIVSFNPATTGSAVAPITIPDPVGVLVDPTTGYLWITEGSAKKIVNYDPINESILYSFNTTGNPNRLIWGPDGNIWFTETNAVGVLTPPTGPGTGSIKKEIAVSGSANDLSVGPSSGTYANTIWFTLSGSPKIGEINVSTESLVGYSAAPDSNARAIALGPDGNEWFTSDKGTPPGWAPSSSTPTTWAPRSW